MTGNDMVTMTESPQVRPAPGAPPLRRQLRTEQTAHEPRRATGVDAARGLALIGMLVVHAGVTASSFETAIIDIASERSRLLFAVTAGMGLAFFTGGIRPAETGRGAIRAQLAVRALMLLVLGYLLARLGPLLQVILDEYGFAFLVLIPLLFLPAGWQLAIGAIGTAVLPGALRLLSPHLEEAAPHEHVWLVQVFVSGWYPVFVWVPVMLLGLGIVRLGVTRGRTVAVALPVSAAVGGAALAGAWMLAPGFRRGAPEPTGSAESDAVLTSLSTIGNVGVCLALTLALIALTTFPPPPAARFARAVLSPVAAMGSMPLTVYTMHVLVLWASIRMEDGILTDDSWLTVGAFLGVALVSCWLWRRYVGRGPLEAAIAVVSGRGRRAAPASAA